MQIDLKKRSDMHLARKVWHMSGVFGLFLAWVYLPPQWFHILMFGLILLFVPADFIRLNRPGLNDFVVHFFKPIMRANELNKLAGTSYLIIGVSLVSLLFPRPVVSLSLLFLAFADPIASLVGIKYGKDKIFGHKSIQGSLAAYFTCVFLSAVYLYGLHQPLDRSIVFSLIAGLVGALAELIPIGKLDDNFSLPVLSALGLGILFYFFGLLI